jgi:hypothetical protein
MKQFIVAIFLCVAFSAVVNAAQRKIAYERDEKIFVADVDGTHSKKLADGALPEIERRWLRVPVCEECRAKRRARAHPKDYVNTHCHVERSETSLAYSWRGSVQKLIRDSSLRSE